MKVNWIIDADMFPLYREELVEVIERQGHNVKLIQCPSPPYRWDDVGCSYRETFPQEACVVAHGDIELVTRIQRERRWVPGAFCSVDNYRCSDYVCWLGDLWINRDYTMLPFGDLRRQRDFLIERFGNDGQVFVRPDSPLKLFTGQIVSDSNFEDDMEFMGFYDFPKSSLVVVSSPKKIIEEWRFAVVEGEIIAGCKYADTTGQNYQSEYPEEALKLASRTAEREPKPDPVWIVDICRTSNGELHLLEIGGFSFADLYACDKAAIVEAVSATALSVWESAQLEE